MKYNKSILEEVLWSVEALLKEGKKKTKGIQNTAEKQDLDPRSGPRKGETQTRYEIRKRYGENFTIGNRLPGESDEEHQRRSMRKAIQQIEKEQEVLKRQKAQESKNKKTIINRQKKSKETYFSPISSPGVYSGQIKPGVNYYEKDSSFSTMETDNPIDTLIRGTHRMQNRENEVITVDIYNPETKEYDAQEVMIPTTDIHEKRKIAKRFLNRVIWTSVYNSIIKNFTEEDFWLLVDVAIAQKKLEGTLAKQLTLPHKELESYDEDKLRMAHTSFKGGQMPEHRHLPKELLIFQAISGYSHGTLSELSFMHMGEFELDYLREKRKGEATKPISTLGNGLVTYFLVDGFQDIYERLIENQIIPDRKISDSKVQKLLYKPATVLKKLRDIQSTPWYKKYDDARKAAKEKAEGMEVQKRNEASAKAHRTSKEVSGEVKSALHTGGARTVPSKPVLPKPEPPKLGEGVLTVVKIAPGNNSSKELIKVKSKSGVDTFLEKDERHKELKVQIKSDLDKADWPRKVFSTVFPAIASKYGKNKISTIIEVEKGEKWVIYADAGIFLLQEES